MPPLSPQLNPVECLASSWGQLTVKPRPHIPRRFLRASPPRLNNALFSVMECSLFDSYPERVVPVRQNRVINLSACSEAVIRRQSICLILGSQGTNRRLRRWS